MACGECKREFQLKHFVFKDCAPECFYQSQWTERRWVFWLIKLAMLVYWFAWFVVSLLQTPNLSKFWIFLTHWDLVLILLYFITSFSVVSFGLWKKTNQQNGDFTEIAESTEISEYAKTSENEHNERNTQRLRWFHIMVWILNIVALDVAIITTITFWVLLRPSSVDLRSVNNHAINSVIVILDLCIHNIPVRLLHFYHTSLFSAIYTTFSFVLYQTGYESRIYNVLDWENNPSFATWLTVGVTLIACPLVHCFVFGIYQFKLFIARKTGFTSKVSTRKVKEKNERIAA